MPKLIYVADDEKNICFLIENFLEKEGYEVECFGDGESLLDAFQKKAPDLCILDIMMPGMDGLTVCTGSGRRAMFRSSLSPRRIPH